MDEDYQTFVRVTDNDEDDDFMELPREKNGTVLLSTIQAQFPDAIGLKYRSSSGAWRGIRAEDNILEAPHGGWGDITYVVTQVDPSKKKSSNHEDPPTPSKTQPRKQKKNKLLEDLVVFGLPFTCGSEELKDYFEEACGDLDYYEVKQDRNTKKSRGFGFIRFKSEDSAREALEREHYIEDRKLTIKMSEKKTNPIKLFVGALPKTVTQDEVKEYFEVWGDMSDVFVPNARGFAFITYEAEEDGRACLKEQHSFKGTRLRVTVAEPREGERPLPRDLAPAPRDSPYGGSGAYGSSRVRERSSERYDKYRNDRHDERRGGGGGRSVGGDRYDRGAGAGASFDRYPEERRRGGGGGGGRDEAVPPPVAPVQKDLANELKTMLFTLLNNQKR